MSNLSVHAGAMAGLEVMLTDAAFWILGLVVATVLGAACVRVVAEHERVIVSRLGRRVAVRGPGIVLHVPGLEHLMMVSLRPVQVRVSVWGSTSEGVPVHVVASATFRITDPTLTPTAVPDPISAATAIVEARLAKEAVHVDLMTLLASRDRLESNLPQEPTAITASCGVTVDGLELNDIEARLTAELLRSAHRHTKRGER
jgi:regulator of protease activity HflC (stomatin/prohibitin superfamily)